MIGRAAQKTSGAPNRATKEYRNRGGAKQSLLSLVVNNGSHFPGSIGAKAAESVSARFAVLFLGLKVYALILIGPISPIQNSPGDDHFFDDRASLRARSASWADCGISAIARCNCVSISAVIRFCVSTP